MKITVFDHSNDFLLGEISKYDLPIETKKADVRELFQQAQNEVLAFVSPANSFGFMNGGIDAVYMQMFPGVEDRVRKAIWNETKFNELLVGDALTVAATMDEKDVWLIAAPTMRTPSVITDPSAVYLATRAAIREASNLHMDHVMIPGMGTGVGAVHPILAARNMALGIKHGLDGDPEFKTCAESAVQNEVLKRI